jgi:hypothetical protein
MRREFQRKNTSNLQEIHQRVLGLFVSHNQQIIDFSVQSSGSLMLSVVTIPVRQIYFETTS